MREPVECPGCGESVMPVDVGDLRCPICSTVPSEDDPSRDCDSVEHEPDEVDDAEVEEAIETIERLDDDLDAVEDAIEAIDDMVEQLDEPSGKQEQED